MTAPAGPEPEERATAWADRMTKLAGVLDERGWRMDADVVRGAGLQVSALQADVAQLAADRDSLRKAGEEMEAERDEALDQLAEAEVVIGSTSPATATAIYAMRRAAEIDPMGRVTGMMRHAMEKLVVDYLVATEHYQAERDGFRAEAKDAQAEVRQLAHELGLTVAERDEALRMLAKHQSEESARWMPAVRERNAMRPVVEAAVAWVRAVSTQPWTDATEAEILAAEHAMCAAVDQMGARTDRSEPQSDAEGSGVAQDVREALGAQKGAHGAEKCRCGHDSEHHTWRGSGCQCCFGCDSFADHACADDALPPVPRGHVDRRDRGARPADAPGRGAGRDVAGRGARRGGYDGDGVGGGGVKVSIDAGGREVEIECSDANVSISAVATEALMLWRATEGATLPAAGAAFGLGLAAVDLATDRTPTTTMRQHPGVPE